MEIDSLYALNCSVNWNKVAWNKTEIISFNTLQWNSVTLCWTDLVEVIHLVFVIVGYLEWSNSNFVAVQVNIKVDVILEYLDFRFTGMFSE